MSNQLASYMRRGRHRVEGWMQPGAAEMILAIDRKQKQLGLQGNIAELGVHHGKLFILLCLLRNDAETALAVDLFEQQDLNVDKSGEGDSRKLVDNLKRHASLDHVVIHHADTSKLTSAALTELCRGKIRLISVDAGHTAELTLNDLELAEGALCDGGVVVLDDCFNEKWPGVCDGVHMFFSQPRKLAPFAIGGNKLFLCEPCYAAWYKSELKGLATHEDSRSFCGSAVLCCDFAPMPLTQRIGQTNAWHAIKNIGPIPLMRVAYRRIRSLG